MKHPDVLVIGGGVIGMSCAYELSKRGAAVTVIDKGDPGFGCSYGNAGWITPCFAMPLPMPGMMFKALGWLTDPDSPLYIKPEASLTLLQWLIRFLMSTNRRQAEASAKSLIEISKFSLEAYSKLSSETGVDISFEKKGLLMIAQTQGGLGDALEELRLASSHGVPGKAMSPDEIRELEPAITGKLMGGVYFSSEAHAEPLAVVQAFTQGAIKNGAQVLPRTELIDFETDKNQKILTIRTTRGILKAEKYVLATGAWSRSVARHLRLRVPIMGGKGYAIITQPLSPNPSHPIMIIDRKIAITPRKNSLRLAGTLELVNQDDSITPRRVDAIIRGSRESLNIPEKFEYSEIWRGLRPCTPDGVPIIGHSKEYTNLLLATGHQMLGLQSAPGTGRLAADLITGSQPTFDPQPFRADRF